MTNHCELLLQELPNLLKIREEYSTSYLNKQTILKFEIRDGNLGVINGFLLLSSDQMEPAVRFELNNATHASFPYDEYVPVSKYFQAAGKNLEDIITECQEYLKKKLINKKAGGLWTSIISRIQESKRRKIFFTTVITSMILVRILVATGTYSGAKSPPLYGDFEAQRHWMELTWNLPLEDWYVGGPHNNLGYWRIDYPPLTAYHSLLFGSLASIYEPASMVLKKSRGYETTSHKAFMRFSVLISDLIIYFTAVWALSAVIMEKYHWAYRGIYLALFLGTPAFYLVDHGHFQYNCCMLGFILWAAFFAIKNNLFLTSLMFACAFSFKQLSLYYALGFFAYVLGRIIIQSEFGINMKPLSKKLLKFLKLFFIAGFSFLLGVGLIWAPFLRTPMRLLSVLKAIFPIERGIIHDCGIPTFWHATNEEIWWQYAFYENKDLFNFTIQVCVLFSLPTVVGCILHPTKKVFLITMYTVPLAWFTFSYHVHEKTILLPLLGMCLAFRYFGIYFVDFSFVAMVCLTKNLVKDQQSVTMIYFLAINLILGPLIISRLKVANVLSKHWAMPVTMKSNSPSRIEKLICNMDRLYLIMRYPFLTYLTFLTYKIGLVPYPEWKTCYHLIHFSIAGLIFNMIGYLRGNLMIWSELLEYRKKSKEGSVKNKLD